MQFSNKVASSSDLYGLAIVVIGRISKNVKSPINGLYMYEFPLINVEDLKYQLYA